MQTENLHKPWEQLSSYLETGDSTAVLAFIEQLNPADTALTVSRLTLAEQGQLLTLLDPEDAAEVIEGYLGSPGGRHYRGTASAAGGRHP